MASAPATIAAPAEFIPANYFAPLDLETIYGNRAPLEVDLGCGDGLFLAAAAAANPFEQPQFAVIADLAPRRRD